MSQLHIQDIAPPDPLPHKRVSGRLTQATRNASIPTWGQIKTLCHQARGIASLQGSPASPEKLFIAMLALLSCQVSASPIPTKYWAYLPDPPTFQVVTWDNEPIRVNTDQPQLLGGQTPHDNDSGSASLDFPGQWATSQALEGLPSASRCFC